MILRRTIAVLLSAALVVGAGVAASGAATAVESSAPSLPVAELSGASPTFRWSAVDGAVGYSLEVALGTAATSTRLATIRTTNTRWIPTAEIGTTDVARTLYWRVAPYSTASDSSLGSWSDWGTYAQPATQTPVPVSPPDDAQVAYPDPVIFRWTATPGATAYEVQYTSEPTGWANSQTLVVKGGTSASPSTLLARTRTVTDESGSPQEVPVTWRWHVRPVLQTTASSTTTAGPYGPERDFTVIWSTSDRPTLVSPANLEAPGADITIQSDPVFRWAPVEGAAKYRIDLGTDANDDRTEVRTIGMTVTTTSTVFVPSAPMLDSQYFWQVTPIDPSGDPGPASDVWLFKKEWGPQSGPSALDDETSAYPVPLVGAATQATAPVIPIDKLELKWEPLARASAYRVEINPLDGKLPLTCVTTGTSATVIVGYSTAGSGSSSGSSSSAKLAQQGQSCLWSTATPLVVGTSYRWRVRAIDAPAGPAGALEAPNSIVSDWSDPQSSDFPERRRYFTLGEPTVADPAQVSLAPDAVTADSTGDPAPLVSWDRREGADFYIVEVGLNPTMSTNLVATFATTQTHLRASGVFANNTVAEAYYWRVRAATGTPSVSSYTQLGEWSNVRSWTRRTSPSSGLSSSPQSQDPSTVVVSWAPQYASAPLDGGSRGYAVTVLNSSGGTIGTAGAPVEHPFFVMRTPGSGKSLTAGWYTVRVAPLDASGAPSGSPSVEIPVYVPGAKPGGLLASAEGAAVRFAWNPAAIASKYTVSYREQGATTWSTIDTPGVTTVVVPDLKPGTYEWQVATTDADGTTYATLGSPVVVAPRNPVLLTVDGAGLSTSTATSGTQPLTLSWEPVGGASRYVVRIAPEGTAISSGARFETSRTSFTPLGLSATSPLRYGTAYQWQVQALPETPNSTVVLGTSETRRFTVTSSPDKMNPPTVSLAGTSASATWTIPSGAAAGSPVSPSYDLRFRVQDPEGIGFEWTTRAVAAQTSAALVSGLATDTTYEFSIRARNAEGASPWSEATRVTTPTTPGAVTNLVVVPQLGALQVTWGSPASTGGSNVTGYVLEYWTATETPKRIASAAPSVRLDGLKRTSSYSVRVAAVNAVGQGPWFTTKKTTLGLPGSPQSLTATRGNGVVKLAWAAPSSAGGSAVQRYVVERRQQSGSTWSTWSVVGQTASAAVRSFTSSGLANGVTYQFRVSAVTAAGQGAASAAVSGLPAGPPGPPTGLSATPTKGKVVIRWSKPVTYGSTLTGYTVQYSTNGTSWKTLTATAATRTSYTWTTASKGKAYYVRVTAKSNMGVGQPSGGVAFTAQ